MSGNVLTRASKVGGVAVLFATLCAATYAGSKILWRDLLGFETQDQHLTDIRRIEKKLDCALFNLPTDCRDNLSPASYP